MFTATRIEGPGWQANGVTLAQTAAGGLALNIARLQWVGQSALSELRVQCPVQRVGAELHCGGGSLSATIPQWGTLQGTVRASFADRARWRAQLEIPRRRLSAVLTQVPGQLDVAAQIRDQPAGPLRDLAAAFGVGTPGKLGGQVNVELAARLTPGATTARVGLRSGALDYNEPSGRYAAEKLAAGVEATWDSAEGAWKVRLAADGGQLYVEPVFLDFAALPARAVLTVMPTAELWRLPALEFTPGAAGTLRGSAQFMRRTGGLVQADLTFDATDLGPLVVTAVQPFLIGTRLEGLTATGRARGTVSVRAGRVQQLSAALSEVGLAADRLGVSLDGLAGNFNWASTGAAPSRLAWRQGAMARVPLGASVMSFRAQGAGFELLAPWRQPLLEGALRVERLALRGLGGTGLTADFQGVLEPIRLAELCQALGWPVFGGTLGGQLPGLRVQDQMWSLDGALDAQVFDGTVRLANVRALEPFGVVPRITADARMRGLDLEALTGAFEFGRITGRLDGDVQGLKLLAWEPVAFDARLYSSPGQGGPRRISQRAIDTISSIGGGPSGVLSRGFLRLFKDFSYARLGISCVLRDGVCRMDGIGPAPAQHGRAGYYLVEGRWLPRIDVVGYSRAVSWSSLVRQVSAARASDGPQLE